MTSDDLYALAPEDFTRVRDEQVKAARAGKDRARATKLAGLRRPTASAYAINALARAQPELLDQLIELGHSLAQAQAGQDAGQLRALGDQRRALVEAVADRAAVAAERDLGPGPRAEVVATLEAALADPESGAAVRSGRLVRALSYAGFGGVDLDGAVAPSAAPPPRETSGQARKPGSAQDRAAQARAAEARQAALEAAGALDDAVQAAAYAEAEGARLEQGVESAAQHVRDVEQQLADARTQRDESEQALRHGTRALDRAHDAVRLAQRDAERARAAVERLGP